MTTKQTRASQNVDTQRFNADAAVVAVPRLFLGVDGGGTKTQAVLADETGRQLAEARTNASNPLRVGVENAVDEIVAAVDRACDSIGKQRADVSAAQIGLAGVRRADLRERMRDELIDRLGVEQLNVVTDAEIALYGAVDGKPGLVIIAGTGSICCGRNATGEMATAGGWGPLAGDEGGGAGIARRALQSIAKASDGRAAKTILSEFALDYFRAATVDDLSTAIYAPGMTNDKIAGFARFVIEGARQNDAVSINLLEEAARELALAATAVINKLKLQAQTFQVAYVGGIFAAQNLIFEPLINSINLTAPNAYLAPPQFPPAIAAAKMAFALTNAKQTVSESSATKPKISRTAARARAPLHKRLRP